MQKFFKKNTALRPLTKRNETSEQKNVGKKCSFAHHTPSILADQTIWTKVNSTVNLYEKLTKITTTIANLQQNIRFNTIPPTFWLESGVPQGGIPSPIIFVTYGADMELWLKHSSALTYADDTSSSVTC